MARPIPLICRDSAATGFLVAEGPRVWLVTCVHLVSGLRDTPHVDRVFTGASIRIAGRAGELPLMVDGEQRFSVVTNTTDGHLVDALAIRLTECEIDALVGFGTYDRGAIVGAEEGDRVTGFGFPALGEKLTKGGRPDAAEEAYNVETIKGVSILLSRPGTGGLSGGPVVSEGGLVGIMQGDIGAPDAMTNALVVSLKVVGGALLT